MKLSRFQGFALLTTASTYLLIGIGGLVRASGAGLGCPDWPRCFDRWIPPTSVTQVPPHIDPALFNLTKAWTEYLNRVAGAVVGLLIFATLLLAIRYHRKQPRVLYPTVAAFLLVGFEGWLGGMVVRSALKPLVLTAHLVFALIIVSLLLYATTCAFFPEGTRPDLQSRRRRLFANATTGVITLALVQVGLGAAVRGELQTIASTSSLPRALWLSEVGVVNLLHKNLAVVTGAAVLGLVWWIFTQLRYDKTLRKLGALAGALTFGQAGAGVGLANLGLPPWLQVAHLWLGSLLLGVLTVLALVAYRWDPREARSVSVVQQHPFAEVPSGFSIPKLAD